MKITYLPILVIIFLAGCHTVEDKKYYQLPSVTYSQQAKQITEGDHIIVFKYLLLADYLDNIGIVYETSDVNYTIAKNNLWISGLQQQLQQTLIDHLNAKLNNWLVSVDPSIESDKSLAVIITQFHGRYDGNVVISGHWILQDKMTSINQPFEITLPQQGDGYANLVRTLSVAWQQQSEQIARIIATRVWL